MYLLLLLPPFLVVLSKNYIHRSLLHSTVRMFTSYFHCTKFESTLPDATHAHRHDMFEQIAEKCNGSFPCRETNVRTPFGIGAKNRMHSECTMRAVFVRNVCFEIDCHVVNGRILASRNMQSKNSNKNIDTEKHNTHRSALTEVSAIFTLC